MKKEKQTPTFIEAISKIGHEFIGIFRAIPKWVYVAIFPFLIGVFVTSIFFNSKQIHNDGRIPPQSLIIGDSTWYRYAYEGKTREPCWVWESINFEIVDQIAEAPDKIEYFSEPDIPSIIQSDLADYQNSGFDIARLPLSSSNDLTRAKYPLSICSPQLPQFHRIYWAKLENYVKTLVKKLNVFHVMIARGPLYLPHKTSDGKKYVTYQVIGENNVAVPTHFFMAIFYPVAIGEGKGNEDWTVSSEIYVVPNQDITENTPLESFRVNLEELEKISGILFPKDMKPYFIDRLPIIPFP